MGQFVVGGAVRDVLLGRQPKDIDYVWTGMTEQDMLDKGFQRVGASFPVFLDEDGNEHALARTEKKTGHGYHGFDVNFDTSVKLSDDLLRRDLTINALAVAVEQWDTFVRTRDPIFVLDNVGGIEDLNNKILRHVSMAFVEDPLRVLRVARFAARLGAPWRIADETLDLMKALVASGETDHLTKERVWNEMSRAVMENYPDFFFYVMELVNADERVLHMPAPDPNDYDFRPCWFTMRVAAEFRLEEWQRWIAFFRYSSPHHVEPIIEKWNMPKDLQTKVIMALRLHEADSLFRNFGLAGNNYFKQFRLNQQENFEQFIKVVHTILLVHGRFTRAGDWIRAVEEARQVVVSDPSLEGKEIGEDLTRQRKKIFSKYLNDK